MLFQMLEKRLMYMPVEAEIRLNLIDGLLSKAGWSQERGNLLEEYALKVSPKRVAEAPATKHAQGYNRRQISGFFSPADLEWMAFLWLYHRPLRKVKLILKR